MKTLIACAVVLMACSVSAPRSSASDTADHSEGLFQRLDTNSDSQVDAAEIPQEHERLFARLLRRADGNSDGRLSAEEFAAGLKPSTPPKPIAEQGVGDRARRTRPLRLLLLKLDTDQDAFLTRAETPPGLIDAFEQLAAACDSDKNGEIAFRELVQSNQQAVRVASRVVRRERWDIDAELRRLERQQGDAAARFDRPPSPRAVLGNAQRLDSLFKTLDYDSDGQLTKAELPEEARGPLDRLLTRADRNRDGKVTKGEFRSAGEQLNRVMHVADRLGLTRPGQGGPTPASDAKERAEPAERSPGRPDGARASSEGQLVRQMLRRMDSNKDKQITRAEARGPLARRFDRADANSDGRIDQRELVAVARIVQSRINKSRSPEN